MALERSLPPWRPIFRLYRWSRGSYSVRLFGRQYDRHVRTTGGSYWKRTR